MKVVEDGRPTAQQLGLIYDAVHDPIILMGVEGPDLFRVASINAAFTRVTGIAVADAVGKLIHELGPGGGPSRFRDTCARVVKDQAAVSYEEHVEFRGKHIAALITLTPIIEDGRCTHLMSLSHDITKETVVIEALRESEARYRTQFEHAPEAILTFDLDNGRFIEANGNALRLFGHTREELLRIGPVDLSPEWQPNGRASRDASAEHIEAAFRGETPVFEWTHTTKSGRLIPCEVRLVRLPGSRRHCRGSIIDITERKHAEELKRLSTALLEQNRLILAANRLKNEFVANMSHELRTPLNAILGFAELLHDGKIGPVSDEQRGCLSDVLRSGRHLLSLINGMLDLAKVESGRLEISPEPIDLRAVVTEATDVLRGLAARKRIQLEAEVDPAIGVVVADPARLKQVLFNYVSNALKFTPEGGRVVVRASGEGERMFRLAVEDTGIGIRDEDLGKLFIEFLQLDAGMTKHHEGTGLGLVLTKRIVEAQGGHVEVTSALGRGSVFSAVLPRASARAARPAADDEKTGELAASLLSAVSHAR